MILIRRGAHSHENVAVQDGGRGWYAGEEGGARGIHVSQGLKASFSADSLV